MNRGTPQGSANGNAIFCAYLGVDIGEHFPSNPINPFSFESETESPSVADELQGQIQLLKCQIAEMRVDINNIYVAANITLTATARMRKQLDRLKSRFMRILHSIAGFGINLIQGRLDLV